MLKDYRDKVFDKFETVLIDQSKIISDRYM